MAKPQYFDEDTHAHVHGEAIADLSLATPTANETEIQDAVNAILATLRSARLIAQD